MNTTSSKLKLMIKVAKLYYMYDISQKDIAQQLDISRGYVCQLLDQAREHGIVEIKVNDLGREESELERHLRDQFRLEKAIAIAVPELRDSPDTLNSEIAMETCSYLDSVARSGMVIAFSWGRTIHQVSARMKRHVKIKDVWAVPLCGGISNLDKPIYATEIATNIAGAYNGTPLSIPLPAILESEEIKNAVYGDANVRRVLDRSRNADIALFTVGEFGERNSLYLGGFIDEATVSHLQKEGAVGDLCAHFINDRGEVCDPSLDRRTVSIDLGEFTGIRHKVCVATGLGKVPALLGALRRGCADVLITSEDTARALLRLE